MKLIDYGAIVMLFVLGCVHNFVAAPLTFEVLDTRALWFVTGGIVLWYAAIINFIWLRSELPSAAIRALTALANAILLAFAIAFMAVRQSWGDAQNIALLAPTAWLLFVRYGAHAADSPRRGLRPGALPSQAMGVTQTPFLPPPHATPTRLQ